MRAAIDRYAVVRGREGLHDAETNSKSKAALARNTVGSCGRARADEGDRVDADAQQDKKRVTSTAHVLQTKVFQPQLVAME